MNPTWRQRIEFSLYELVHKQPAGIIRWWQDRRLRGVFHNAVRHVPLWRELMANTGIDADSVTLATLHSIPTTSKSMYIGRPLEELIDGSRPIRPKWNTTSGTSGHPFSFVGSDWMNSQPHVDFGLLRFLMWNGAHPRDLATVKMARIKIRANATPNRLFVSVADFEREPLKAIQEIRDFAPEVLSSYPSVLLEIAELTTSAGILLSVPYVLSFGEMCTPAAREKISRALHTEVYDRYGIEEFGAVALECKMHDGFHVNCESFIIEVVDENNAPVPDGHYGRILITDLFNYNMPFIRYDTGDHGSLSWRPCPCGLASPRLRIDGRYSAYLRFGSRKIHHLQFDGALDSYMNRILQYQIAKTSETEVSVRIVPGPTYDEQCAIDAGRSVQRIVGPHVRVSIETIAALPRTPYGKSRIVIDESAA